MKEKKLLLLFVLESLGLLKGFKLEVSLPQEVGSGFFVQPAEPFYASFYKNAPYQRTTKK